MFKIKASTSGLNKGRAAANAGRAAHRGRKPHPATTLDTRYTAAEDEFLRAYDRTKRETGAAGVGLLRATMARLGYVGTVSDAAHETAVQAWRLANGRPFPPASAHFGMLLQHGYAKGGPR